MERSKIAAAVLGTALLVTGCSAGQDDKRSSDSDSAVGAQAGTSNTSANHVEALGGSTVAFDKPAQYEDGLSITVSDPQPFTPSKAATTGGEENHVKFTIELVNGSGKKISPTDILVTVDSGGGQGGDILDPKNKMTGAPTKPVKPGAKVRWLQGFGVLDPDDVEVVVQAGLNRVPMLFTD
jgi:hypothetical protein